jgi:hypothetical protein
MNWTGDGLLRHVVWDQGGQARKRGHAGATGRVGSAVLPLPLVQYGGTEGTKEGDKKPRESAEFEAWSASPLGDASNFNYLDLDQSPQRRIYGKFTARLVPDVPGRIAMT